LYVSQQGGTFKVGLRIQRRHCNTMGHCHGGMLATFADMMMPVVMYPHEQLVQNPRFLSTWTTG
jgi:acyl-coenzyme A thioesterase PaaI-like protein